MSLLALCKSELAGLCNLFLPAACPLCRNELPSPSPNGLCPTCLEQLPPLPASRCPRCALPFAAGDGSAHVCEACLRHPPEFNRTFAVGSYAELLREAVHRFKYENALHLDRALGVLLAERIEQSEASYRPELIIPVPLNPQRLRHRGYNQALLIARQLGKRWRVPVAPRRLLRHRPTPPQQGLSLTVRQQNLRGAFSLNAPLCGEKILLVDDVMTTGATLRECAHLLHSEGAGEIGVAVIGRALRHL